MHRARLAIVLLALAACSRGHAPAPEPRDTREARALAPLDHAVVTTETATVVPARGRASPADPRSSADPAARAALLAEGWGETQDGPGEPAKPPPAGARRVLRMVHLTDVHLVDDESPLRSAAFDDPTLPGAFRPQEGYACRVLDAAVRTIDRLHEDDPLDLVLLGGDAIDDAQSNELSWLLAILRGGAPVACDSGQRDDPVPGPDNDAKDPFTPRGLAPAWYWVTGNHDVLVQGNFPADDAASARATGPHAKGGARDYRLPGAPVTRGDVPPDPRRALLSRAALLAQVGDHAPGDYARSRARAFYAVDVPGSPVRVLVLDTAAETGGAAGLLRRADVDGFLGPELDRAARDGKHLIVASHHALDALNATADGSAAGGTRQPDAVPPSEIAALLRASGRVLFVLAGHGHRARIRDVGGGLLELETGALADWPAQMRLLEIWEDSAGALSLRTVMVNVDLAGAPLAEGARELAAMDFTTGWSCCGAGERADRDRTLSFVYTAAEHR
jgi:3',5'-cyclic AMP phosphodiesterase CpdA